MEGRGVQVFEKKNGRLEPRGMLPGVKHTTDLTYWAGRLYVASGGRGLFVYDVTDTRKESLLGHLRVDATILSLAIHPWSSTLYIMAGSRGMATVSIRDPKNPKIMGWIPTKGPALRANATRSHLALVDYESLRLFSLENPKKPTLAARRRIPAGKGGALTLAVTSRGQHVYAASWYGLEVYRVDLQQRAPIAEFATRDIELEPKGDEFEAVFRIKNTGSSPLEVRFAEASHDLFVLPKPVTLPSGKESLLRITTRTRLPAGETGGITLRTNDPHEPTVRLSVRTKRTMDSWAAWAQTVEFQRESKGTFGLQAHRGKVIVLAYFASFCPPCFKEFPELERDIWAPFRNQGVRLFGVSGPTDGPSNITRFREQTGVTFDLVSSAAPPTKLATPGTMVTYYPFHVVIGADGSVRYVGTDLNTGKLVKEVRHALREAVEKETAK